MGNVVISIGKRMTVTVYTEAVNIIKLSIEPVPSMAVQLMAMLTKVLNLQMADS